ncbi:MAG: hypothetical protein JWN48_4797 [Myxococcaceae bacterium]|nr:hypothetical protein [Myxococcaceae bacterium]
MRTLLHRLLARYVRLLIGRACLVLAGLTFVAIRPPQSASAQARVAPHAATIRSLAMAEPSVREVVRMAVAAARRLGPERVRELSRRARLAGLVPQLKLSADRGLQQDLSSSASTATARTNAATGDDLSLGATLTFDFDRLVFATEEVRLLSVERWLVSDQRKLVADVVRLYFQRRRLIREQASAQAPDAELEDQIVEAEALLDGYTDGAFGAALERLRERAR